MTLAIRKYFPSFGRSPARDLGPPLQMLMFGRLAVLFFSLTVVLLIQLFRQGGVSPFHLALGYFLLAVAFGFNLSHALLLERIPARWWVVGVHILFDAAIASTWIYFAGEDSAYALLYLVQILIVALVFHQWVALASAVVASAAYGTVLFLLGGEVAIGWGIHAAAFVVLALVGGLLSQQLYNAAQSLKEKQSTIDKLRAFQERIVTDIPTGLLTVDEEMRINFINPAGAQILGRKALELVGTRLTDVEEGFLPFFTNIQTVPVEDDSTYAEPSPGIESEVSSTGDDQHRSYFVNAKSVSGRARLQQMVEVGSGEVRRVIRGDVAELDADAALGQLLGEKAKRGRVLLFQDVTKLRHLEDKLKQHEKLAAVGQLAAGIAHEIRNPLASMSASIELLKGSLPEKVQGTEEGKLMDIAIREIDRLNDLISEFLDFVRPVKMNLEPVNLKEVLTDLVLAARKRKDLDPTITIRENYDTAVIARGSQEKLKQVIWNLLVNAFQAMSRAGCIEVGCSKFGDGKVKLWVEDQGVGMSEEVRRRLFEPFFTTKDKGTGLGLATVYKIVEAHHGEIRVDSREKIGTKFEVILQAA
ncbi:MAG: hypothetical protein KDD51_11920 [Bdellovibrionales bacterium]|nr:hypothetical protein [Bdellovibrionales bacterium]